MKWGFQGWAEGLRCPEGLGTEPASAVCVGYYAGAYLASLVRLLQ